MVDKRELPKGSDQEMYWSGIGSNTPQNEGESLKRRRVFKTKASTWWTNVLSNNVRD